MSKNRIFKRLVTMLMTVAMVATSLGTFAMAAEPTDKMDSFTLTGELVTNEAVDGVASYDEVENSIQPYSIHTASGSFRVSLTSKTYSFDGNDFHVYIQTHNSAGDVGAYPKVYHVYLYRKGWLGGTLAGNKVEVNRHRDVTITWAGVGPGDYYLVFTKANDGTIQYLDYIKMYN